MSTYSRRRFMHNVGSGMLIAGLGGNLAIELGVANQADLRPLTTAPHDDLAAWVGRMQDMNPDKLQIKMAEEISAGSVSLRELIAASEFYPPVDPKQRMHRFAAPA